MKKAFLLLGDVVALYASLVAALLIRYNDEFYEQLLAAHLIPFSVIFAVWVLVFYVAGLYDLRRQRNGMDFIKMLSLALVLNAGIAILLFYLVPIFGIAPKTNLLIFIAIFAVVEFLWRRTWNRTLTTQDATNQVLLIGTGDVADEIVVAIENNPQLGFAVRSRMSEETIEREPESLAKIVGELGTSIIVVPRHLKRNPRLSAVLFELFGRGIAVIDMATFYERVLQKIPLADLEETWFIENVEHTAQFYDPLKRAFETVAATLIMIVLLPFEILFALIVKVTSRGPAIYKQVRVGQYGRTFMLYKFRTMRIDAEKDGAQWAAHSNDPRSTLFGKFLRASHLDELPQLWNIIRGDISFVGPRPERPEFLPQLKQQVPYYEARLLVKPGVTGWAQINYRNDQTIEDVKQKIQYDIYYLKNRSMILDIAVVLKTAKSLFVNPE